MSGFSLLVSSLSQLNYDRTILWNKQQDSTASPLHIDMSDLLIKGGSLIDGTGAPPRHADVRIRAGVITEVAQDLTAQGETLLDASNAIVSPGFIDSHTHLDATVFWDALCDPMPQHGVTTVAVGNCSLGFAPVRPEDRELQADVFSYIEDVPLKVLTDSVPWNWESFEGYIQVLEQRKLGVNLAVLVGHSQLRSYVMGEAAWHREANATEIAAIAQQLRRALAAGAFGLSFSLFDKDRSGRWVPSHYVNDAEMEAVFTELAVTGGIFQFIPSTATMETIIEGLEWVGSYLVRFGITGLYNLVMDRAHDPSYSGKLLRCLEGLHAKGAKMYGMVTPRPFENFVGFEQTICFMAIPAWNDFVQADAPRKRFLLTDQSWRARARADFEKSRSVLFPVWRLDLIRITAAKSELSAWIGRTLKDLVESKGGHASDVLADWVLENDLDANFVCTVGNIDQNCIASLIRSPYTFISASDAGAHLQMFSGAGDSTLLLTRYVRERKDFPLQEAIHFLTGRQADLLGIRDRGRVLPGLAADLAIFNLDELYYGPEITVHDLPGNRPRFSRAPGGYRYTIVNGDIVQVAGTATGALPARLLKPTLR
jgi:N-acyl-D-amino-acid deacylase